MTIRRWSERCSNPGWGGDLTALAAGALLPLAFAPFHLFPLAWLAPALLFILWLTGSPRLAFRRGLLFGLGMFGVGVSWVYVAIHDFGLTAAPVATLLTALFVAVLALYPGIAGYAASRLFSRFSPALRLLLVFPVLWVGFEWIRGRFLTGFPWLNLGYSQIDTPLAGIAPVFGVYALSLLAALIAGALAFALLRGRHWFGVAALTLALMASGALLQRVAWTDAADAPISVSLVQGNLPQLTKWDPVQIQLGLDRYAELTVPLLGQSQLVIWPENAVTVFYHELADGYFAWLGKAARARGTDLVLGVPLLDGDGQKYYTTMMSLGSAQDFYRKSHLVPFGEFVPLEGLLRGLVDFFDLPMSSFTAGAAIQPPLAVAGSKAAVSVCYEDAFGEEIIGNVADAGFLVNGSNNAWYGNSLAPHQHLQIARMRALETGRPLLRATTNGISAIVGHRGEILARSEQFQVAVVNGAIEPRTGLTPYIRWGNAPVLALVVLILVSLQLVSLMRKRKATEALRTQGE